MIHIEVIGCIAPENSWFGDNTFSAEKLAEILAGNPDPDILLDIDSDGGSTEEGFKIYDMLRMSGRNIYANIRGACHSIATVILLAAPKGNRSANRNVRALIHQVHTEMYGCISTEEARNMSDILEMEQEAILDIYTERTGADRKFLRNVIQQEKVHDANSLLEMGFIDRINQYTTNQLYNCIMAETKSSAYVSFMERMANYFKKHEIFNYDYKDVEGNIVFSTSSSNDSLSVGDRVKVAKGDTEGEFVLADGRKVNIEDNVVTAIESPNQPGVGDMEERVRELEDMLEEARRVIDEQEAELRRLRGSREVPPSRQNYVPTSKSPASLSKEDIIKEAREKQRKAAEAEKLIK